jgi:uncharacterized protein (DUF2267 family)
MVSYRALAHSFQKRAGISFESALAAISFTIKALSHQLTLEEALIFRRSLPMELRQLVSEGRAKGHHNADQMISLISAQVEIAPHEAKRRTLGLIEELRNGISPWDEVEFLELLDRLHAEINAVLLPSIAA